MISHWLYFKGNFRKYRQLAMNTNKVPSARGIAAKIFAAEEDNQVDSHATVSVVEVLRARRPSANSRSVPKRNPKGALISVMKRGCAAHTFSENDPAF